MEKMKTLIALTVVLAATGWIAAQGSPDIVWQAPTPNGLSNSVMAVGWSPVTDDLAVGSTDRWFRLRDSADGVVAYSTLEPQKSNGVGQIVYAIDGGLIGVVNRAFSMQMIVQRPADGMRLGSLIATVASNGWVSFAPDGSLIANTGEDGTLARWRFSDLTLFQTTGSGYQKVSTAFNFSPNGLLQTAASRGTITVRRRADGAVEQVLSGGSVVVFSPDSTLLASVSSPAQNEVTIRRTSDWTVLHVLQLPDPAENVGSLRFSRDGLQLVSTGYFPFVDQDGLWQQKGIIRFWRVPEGTDLRTYDEGTDLAVTSPISWSPDGTRFAYGLYDGTVAVARAPGESDTTGTVGGSGTRRRPIRRLSSNPGQ